MTNAVRREVQLDDMCGKMTGAIRLQHEQQTIEGALAWSLLLGVYKS